MDRILLGYAKWDDMCANPGRPVYLTKHQWDCGWYWGFGYVGNSACHFHFDSLITHPAPYEASALFSSPAVSDSAWWVIRDLFKQAYALKQAAEVYRHGGHQTTKKGLTDIIQDLDKAKVINADLETVLNTVWNFILEEAEKHRANCENMEQVELKLPEA